MKKNLLGNLWRKAMVTTALLMAGAQGMSAATLFSGEKVFTDYAGLEVEKEAFADVAAGDVIKMVISACEESDAKFAFKQKDNGWVELTGFEWVDVAAPYTYEYTVTETTAEELAAYGLVIQGNNITVTQVELVASETPEPTAMSFVIYTGNTAAGNWENAVQIGIPDLAEAAVAEGDVLRVYTSDIVKDDDNASQLILAYSNAEWNWTDFATDYQYYNFATTTAYCDFKIEGELLDVLTAKADEKALLIRGKNYTATKVEIIKADAYYISLSEKNTACYIAGQAAKVNLERKLLAGYNTLTLPFSATAQELTGSDEAYLAELSGVNTGEGTVLTFTKVEKTEANKPYLVYVPADVELPALSNKEVEALVDDWHNQTWSGDFYMQGNYTPGKSVEGGYVVSGAETIAPAGSSATIDGMRAYILLKEGADVKGAITFTVADSETAIRCLVADSSDTDTLYNLAGQRTAKAVRGLYVRNGRKFIVK